MIKVDQVYDISFEVEEQEVDEDGEVHPPRMVTETWKNATVVAILKNGNVIVRRPTGIKHTWPRLDEISAEFLDQYEFREITTPEGV